MLKASTVFNVALISAPRSTQNSGAESVPEMHQTKRGNRWFFSMRAQIGVDADSGLVHLVEGAAADFHGLPPVDELLHGENAQVHAGAGYQCIDKREGLMRHEVEWQVAMSTGRRRALPYKPTGQMMGTLEETKARLRTKNEHLFWVTEQQVGCTMLRKGVLQRTMPTCAPCLRFSTC